MNFAEGMRRTGVLLGLIGLCGGCFHSFERFKRLEHQRAEALEFRKLMLLPEVQEEIAKIQKRQKYRVRSKRQDYEFIIFWSENQPPTDADISAILSSGYRVTKGDIRTIHFDGDGKGVAYLKKRNGAIATNSSPPPSTHYLLLIISPVAGFLALWGSVRCIVWIYGGFSKLSAN